MFFRDGRMCLKKDERRGWSYDDKWSGGCLYFVL